MVKGFRAAIDSNVFKLIACFWLLVAMITVGVEITVDASSPTKDSVILPTRTPFPTSEATLFPTDLVIVRVTVDVNPVAILARSPTENARVTAEIMKQIGSLRECQVEGALAQAGGSSWQEAYDLAALVGQLLTLAAPDMFPRNASVTSKPGYDLVHGEVLLDLFFDQSCQEAMESAQATPPFAMESPTVP